MICLMLLVCELFLFIVFIFFFLLCFLLPVIYIFTYFVVFYMYIKKVVEVSLVRDWVERKRVRRGE